MARRPFFGRLAPARCFFYGEWLGIEPEVHYVAVGNDILLAFPNCHGPRLRAIQLRVARRFRKAPKNWLKVGRCHLGGPLLRAMTPVPVGGAGLQSGVEPEVHHITIGDNVFLAFQPELPRLARARLAVAGDVIRIGDGFGADIALFEIGMDDAGGLRAF
jgi:hypothetical protein